MSNSNTSEISILQNDNEEVQKSNLRLRKGMFPLIDNVFELRSLLSITKKCTNKEIDSILNAVKNDTIPSKELMIKYSSLSENIKEMKGENLEERNTYKEYFAFAWQTNNIPWIKYLYVKISSEKEFLQQLFEQLLLKSNIRSILTLHELYKYAPEINCATFKQLSDETSAFCLHNNIYKLFRSSNMKELCKSLFYITDFLCRKKYIKTLKVLIKLFKDVSVKIYIESRSRYKNDDHYYDPHMIIFELCCKYGVVKIVEYLTNEYKFSEDIIDSCFEVACSRGNIEVVKFLMPKINKKYTGLHKSCVNNQYEVVQYLLENGATGYRDVFALQNIYNFKDRIVKLLYNHIQKEMKRKFGE